MRSKTIMGTSVQEIEVQIQQCISNDFKPTLALAFGSISCDLNGLCHLFDRYDIDVVGASSAGEFSEQNVQTESMVVMLLDMNREYFRIHQSEVDYATSFIAGKKLATHGKEQFENPAFIMVFSMTASGENIISGITDEIVGFPKVFGGMAGDDMKMVGTYTFTNGKIGDSTMTALIIDNDKIEVEGLALCGWQPIGAENTITKAKDNVIYSINNEPALNVVKKYFGDFYGNTIEEDEVPMGAAQYPLQLKRGKDVVLRATLFANDNGSLIMAGPVQEGDNFRFSIAPGFEVIDKTIEGFKKYHSEKPDVDALLLFSCKARHMSLGPLIENEIEGIHEIWEKPMAGFFTYGEVGQHGTGSSYFYNETCSLVLLTEKDS